MTRRALALLLAGAVWACGGENGDAAMGNAGPGDTASAADEAPAEIGDLPRRLVGIFATGQGLMELQPCDGSDPVALQGPALENLVNIAEGIGASGEPVLTIFADLVVTTRSAEGTNVGDGYALIADVLGVRRAAYEGFGCDGALPAEVALVAAGNEPFWRVEVGNDTTALLTRPEEGEQRLTVGALQQDFEGVVLNGSVEGEGTVFLEVTTGTCQDSMSGALTHARAVFTIGGRRLEGCAWFGTLLDPDVTPIG